ncbi:2'-5' RNA ligase family protein [Jeotgalibacillus haloalkalitolerans]|uniref:2'-5' RNA ligase family protein n=1 Tax=Jeotgalibacillus haloalkalitolerans TaxID=3104292 RepID=A0ABU5KN20_9BACL|nr:2'-5' RNA ligase family protein [Jeotgalibacillus sp. HH7-29]MDZ5712658.1 2'-5' RNA ligase family protein [Jeotgalibacillus sp. HH7-29]
MKVEYFIGIVPPSDYIERIEQFRSKWTSQSGVEPHITVKAQGGLTPDKKWLDQIRKVCVNVKPFPISLDEPNFLGDHILYLSVHSDGLHQLHRKLVHEISPSEDLIKQYFELNAYIPHLTLVKGHNGGNSSAGPAEQNLKQIMGSVVEELTPYPDFEVNFIRVYELNFETQVCEKYEDITLGY